MIKLGGLEWTYTLALEFWLTKQPIVPWLGVSGFDVIAAPLTSLFIKHHAVDRISGARELPRVAVVRGAANDG